MLTNIEMQQQNTAMVTLKTILTMVGKAVKSAVRAIDCFNKKTAIVLTKIFQSMWTFWFTFLVLIGWIVTNAAGVFHFDPFPFVLLTTVYSCPQLPLLVVMGVGVSLLGRQQEQQSRVQFDTTIATAQHIKHITEHTEQIAERLTILEEKHDRQIAMLIRLLNTRSIETCTKVS